MLPKAVEQRGAAMQHPKAEMQHWKQETMGLLSVEVYVSCPRGAGDSPKSLICRLQNIKMRVVFQRCTLVLSPFMTWSV
jgi:hypothetical protein